METKQSTQTAAILDWPRPAGAGLRVASVAHQLDLIIGRSRRGRLRRAMSRTGQRFARWLDELVPPAPRVDDGEPPPQIRFPFF